MMIKKKEAPSKPPPPVPQDPAQAKEEKSSLASRKLNNEIDEIFAGKKRKKADREKTEKPTVEAMAAVPRKIKKKNHGGDTEESRFVDQPSRPRKKTADGLAIYTEDELGLGRADAGGTPLCPFDCDCCF